MSAVQHSSKETQQQMCTALADPHIFPFFPLKKNREKKRSTPVLVARAARAQCLCGSLRTLLPLQLLWRLPTLYSPRTQAGLH